MGTDNPPRKKTKKPKQKKVKKVSQKNVISSLTFNSQQKHNPKKWQKEFKDAPSDIRRSLRIDILQQTLSAFREEKYKVSDRKNESIPLNHKMLRESAEETELHNDFHRPDIHGLNLESFRNKFNTDIQVLNSDCLDAAATIIKERNQSENNTNEEYKNTRVAVLNNASYKRPGGGYKNGSGAQEEYLHRCSSLPFCLEDIDRLYSKRKWHYPLPEFGGVFCPNVVVIRGNENNGYPFLPEPFFINVISVAAYRNPQTTFDKRTKTWCLGDSFVEKIKQKIRVIFNVALFHGSVDVVLGAWGCGVYKNPPSHVALLFKELLDTEYKGCFRKVWFAIIEDHNSHLSHNKEGNLSSFNKIFNN